MKLRIAAALVLVAPLAVASQPAASATPDTMSPGMTRAAASIARGGDIVETHRRQAEERRVEAGASRRQELYRDVAEGRCPATPSPHFATPAATMRYVARAWNHRDLEALCHVTDSQARRQLAEMAGEAKHLTFHKCTSRGSGSYSCEFVHSYPRFLHQAGMGRAWVTAAPATRPGFYINVYVGCG